MRTSVDKQCYAGRIIVTVLALDMENERQTIICTHLSFSFGLNYKIGVCTF